MGSARRRWLRAVIVGMSALLSSCVVAEEPRPMPEPASGQICTMEYDPVCGRRGGVERTFANDCQARSNGYRVVARGECRPSRPEPGTDRPQICTREYDPVCGRQGRRERTFPNACTAEAGGFRVVGRGECGPRDDAGEPPRESPTMCAQQYDPVCARQGGREQTFMNACSAEARGFEVVSRGQCR